MDYGKIHFSLFPTIQFHIITRNIDHSCRTTLSLSFNAEMFRVSHFQVNHYFLGIRYLCRKVTLSAEMHAKRIARHIIDHENQFPLHWLQRRFNVLFQYRLSHHC